MVNMKIKNKIRVWIGIIAFLPLLLSYGIFLNSEIKNLNNNIEKNLIEIAKLIAKNNVVRKNLTDKDLNGDIENVVEKYIKICRDADIIVVVDMDGRKYSHLDKSQIGHKFVNPVLWDKIKFGEGYYSKMKGSMGITFRRYEPVYNNKSIIGFVMVGKYYENILKNNKKTMLMYIGLFLITISLTTGLGRKFQKDMKKNLFGLEPEEIGRLYSEEKLIIDNLESGLIALNTRNEIVKLNSVFENKYKMLTTDIVLKKLKKYIGNKNNMIKNVEAIINGERFYIKILPIYDLDKYFGMLILIKKREDVEKYLKEITGIDQLVEGMRANIHEFKNRLHVILGLINLGKIDMVKKYILDLQELNQYDFKKYKNIKNTFIKAMLLGKDGVAKERKIIFEIDEESIVEETRKNHLTVDITTILGNLIENSIDSFENNLEVEKQIRVKIVETEFLFEIEVEDNGMKINEENLNRIFDYGFSTKGKHRGVGLFLIKEKVGLYNGSIKIEQFNDYKKIKIKMEK